MASPNHMEQRDAPTIPDVSRCRETVSPHDDDVMSHTRRDALHAPLRVGSDCAGMCTELHALEQLRVPYTHAFCSEVWEPAIRYIRSNHSPKVLYHDMRERELEATPAVDLYVCSSPCQPVSALNHKKRGDDPRREPLQVALAYIREKRPKYWLFENVLGLTRVDKGRVWRALCTELDALSAELGYRWGYQMLDPCKHADSPQSRPRVYICGRLGTARIAWPHEVPLTRRCVDLLDPDVAREPASDGLDLAPCYRRHLRTWGIAPGVDEGIVEFCASSRAHSPYTSKKRTAEENTAAEGSTTEGSERKPPLTPTQRAHVLKTDIAPCMIRHDPGLYAVHLDRMLTAAECLALQGFAPETVETPQVTPLQMRMLCGNAMHCGVLARVLECLLAE